MMGERRQVATLGVLSSGEGRSAEEKSQEDQTILFTYLWLP